MVASSLARVPREGFSWYIFMLEDDFSDALRTQLRDNFEGLGRAVGPDTLVVRGFDPNQIRNEWGVLAIGSPALVVTDRIPIDAALPAGARVIDFDLASEYATHDSIVPLLKRLVEALNDSEAMKLLERDTAEPGAVKKLWGWVEEYLELKPNFMGFGLNMNAFIRNWTKS
jgi:hypothetical protein